MDQEQSWISIKTVGDDDNTAATNYEYFMRPEPRENMSAIRTEYDRLLKRDIKVRDLRIGMTRNAADENKRVVKAYLEPYPHTRIDTAKPLQGWYKSLHEPEGVRPRPCFTEAILTEPYGGWCAVGCAFCYVNSGFRGYRGTGLITVPINYGQQIATQLSKIRRGAAGYFSSFTDPFLPLEELYHNTEQAAEEFVKVGLPIFFLSRLRYPDWAIELMQQNPHSYAQKSINTCDPDDWRYLSPGALPLEEHFEDIRRLRRAGIYVSIQCNPVVAGVTSNEQIVALFKRLAQVGANHVIVKFVEAGYSWAPAMVERMIKRFGERGHDFAALFTENMGGQRTIQEAYRIKAHKLYSAYARKFGLTYATCYEYRYDRDSAGQILDKTGVSIGREFTTSAQCHGHQVPVYARNSADELFQPLEACPPSGCLYCASENDGEPRCGDELAGQAKALKLVDLKLPIAGV
jgi:DNA repair photolyase